MLIITVLPVIFIITKEHQFVLSSDYVSTYLLQARVESHCTHLNGLCHHEWYMKMGVITG